MKRLIFFEIILIFFATTFERDSPPGWFQQSLPVNDVINDIFFIDSLNGWVVTDGRINTNDTAFIMRTADGGNSWQVQFAEARKLNALEFLDMNTGYVVGGTGNGINKLYKTTNGGLNWNESNPPGTLTNDLDFVNKDTGWISVEGNFMSGILMTTDGASTWQQQYTQTSPLGKIFMLSKDTGWFVTAEPSGRLFRTTNGGVNWGLQYTASTSITSIFFINGLKGWIQAGSTNGIQYSTNGGFNWQNGQGTLAGYDVRFINDSIGISGSLPNIAKSTDGGVTWGFQITPPSTYLSVFAIRNDTTHGWAGMYNFIRTTDGGGNIITGITQISNEIPSEYILFQNFPNPFNPVTILKFQISKLSHVNIVVYDIQGREIRILVNDMLNPGTYETDFDASALSSGIYFYSLIIDGRIIDTKKMLLVK